MAIRQLYIDNKMIGPSHGSGIPGPRLPALEDYEKSAEIRAGDGTILARILKDGDGRERYYRRNTGDRALTPGTWRDSIRDDETGYLRIADRCDGKGTIGLY